MGTNEEQQNRWLRAALPYLLILGLCAGTFFAGKYFLNREKQTVADIIDNVKEEPARVINPITGLISDTVKTGVDLLSTQVGVSLAEERQFGASFFDCMDSEGLIANDSVLEGRISKVIPPFLQETGGQVMEYTFVLLEISDFCAFATPGGFVYLSRGLFEHIGDDDTVLAFILGHEIAHIEMGHVAQAAAAMKAGNLLGEMLLGDSGAALGQQTFLMVLGIIKNSYSKKQEFQADEWSFRIMRNSGYPLRKSLRGLEFLKQYEEEMTEEQQPGHPQYRQKRLPISASDKVVAALLEAFNRYWGSHPPTGERIEALRKIG